MSLQNYFQNGNALTGSELKRVADIFTKMFMDSHTKVSRVKYIRNIQGNLKSFKNSQTLKLAFIIDGKYADK